MAKKSKKFGVSFSMNRALGITSVKQKFARATGIPTTRQGRDQKLGRMISGSGCMFCLIFIIVTSTILIFSVKLVFSTIIYHL